MSTFTDNDALLIQEVNNVEIARCVDGTVSKINGDIIPLKHMMYQSPPKDGVFVLEQQTCGGECSIGKPKKACIEKGVYSERKCSVYSFDPVDNATVKLSALDYCKLVKESK